MDADLDTLATALYVKIDELLQQAPQLAPWRPTVGIAPKLSDAELVTLAVMQALLGFTSEARWLRHADRHLRHLFPYLPRQAGYNKRLRGAAGLLRHAIRAVATDTSLWTDDIWIVDSTPVECGRSRETTKRSALAGWAQMATAPATRATSGGCGCTWSAPHGLPVAFADRRQGRRAPGAGGPAGGRAGTVAARPGQTLLADKHYYGREFQAILAGLGVRLLRPARGAASPSGPVRICSARCGSSSSRSTRPSKASSTWSATVAAPVAGRGPGLAAHPRPGRRHLAQPQDRTTDPTVPDRLRPLTLESIV